MGSSTSMEPGDTTKVVASLLMHKNLTGLLGPNTRAWLEEHTKTWKRQVQYLIPRKTECYPQIQTILYALKHHGLTGKPAAGLDRLRKELREQLHDVIDAAREQMAEAEEALEQGAVEPETSMDVLAIHQDIPAPEPVVTAPPAPEVSLGKAVKPKVTLADLAKQQGLLSSKSAKVLAALEKSEPINIEAQEEANLASLFEELETITSVPSQPPIELNPTLLEHYLSLGGALGIPQQMLEEPESAPAKAQALAESYEQTVGSLKPDVSAADLLAKLAAKIKG